MYNVVIWNMVFTPKTEPYTRSIRSNKGWIKKIMTWFPILYVIYSISQSEYFLVKMTV